MSQTQDSGRRLAAFIAARLDEDERIATGALINGRSAEWEVVEGDVQRVDTQGAGSAYVAVGPWDGRVLPGDAAHIVRHDPARVLRDVAAGRAILDEHGTLDAQLRAGPGYEPDPTTIADRACLGCGLNSREDARTEDIDRCPTLRALAIPWSDHPDYDPAWAPHA